MLTTGEVYHVFNKSIAGFIIFNTNTEYLRIVSLIRYYQFEKQPIRFAYHIKSKNENNKTPSQPVEKSRLVDIVAYCVMPTHIHLVLKQLTDNGISTFINTIFNSYTRYFNVKHKRKGPLWEGRFKRIIVENDEQLLHLTRYVHLNPTTASLVNKPELWPASSYHEYIKTNNDQICQFSNIIDMAADKYKKFTEDHISYQRELAKIKNLIIE